MGGTVSSAENNDQLVDNLVSHNCIESHSVEVTFRAVDRAHFMPPGGQHAAYRDMAWNSDSIHLSAPCIYTSALENLDLRRGHRFLNIGSGSGYFSTMAGLTLGTSGVNHGIELHTHVVDFARERVSAFISQSPAVDQFDFCEPQFVVGNALLIDTTRQRYDRVYCGAACVPAQLELLQQLLAIGGVLVVPVGSGLLRVRRLAANKWHSEQKLSVAFASLIAPDGCAERFPPPALELRSLRELCRSVVRNCVRKCIFTGQPELAPEALQFHRKKRRLSSTTLRRTVVHLPTFSRSRVRLVEDGVSRIRDRSVGHVNAMADMQGERERGRHEEESNYESDFSDDFVSYMNEMETEDESTSTDSDSSGSQEEFAGLGAAATSLSATASSNGTDGSPITEGVSRSSEDAFSNEDASRAALVSDRLEDERSSCRGSVDDPARFTSRRSAETARSKALVWNHRRLSTVTVYPSSSEDNSDDAGGDLKKASFSENAEKLSRLMVLHIRSLPLPHHLREYINLGRPLTNSPEYTGQSA